jgi:hypothetical protein
MAFWRNPMASLELAYIPECRTLHDLFYPPN